jgi:truncated hemoglobin YjbI
MQDSPYMIDRMTVYKDLGADKITQLSRAFYTRVYNDSEKWFRDLFAGNLLNRGLLFWPLFLEDRPMDAAIQNQYEFFIQRFGGPDLYSKRKGHPALKGMKTTLLCTYKFLAF